MATDPVKRIENWNTKYNLERVNAILTEKRPKMLEHVNAIYVSLAGMESQVKQVLDIAGASMIQYPFYLCFGRGAARKPEKSDQQHLAGSQSMTSSGDVHAETAT